jgi:hypothetical protein
MLKSPFEKGDLGGFQAVIKFPLTPLYKHDYILDIAIHICYLIIKEPKSHV